VQKEPDTTPRSLTTSPNPRTCPLVSVLQSTLFRGVPTNLLHPLSSLHEPPVLTMDASCCTSTPTPSSKKDCATSTASSLVVIMRGLPGSGKSTRVKHLVASFRDKSCICSADDFFVRRGKYQFDPRQLGRAHQACLTRFVNALSHGVKLVIVDNTNTQRWEYSNYVKIAKLAGAAVRIEELACPSEQAALAANAHNVHGVPQHASLAMFKRWERDERAHVVRVLSAASAAGAAPVADSAAPAATATAPTPVQSAAAQAPRAVAACEHPLRHGV